MAYSCNPATWRPGLVDGLRSGVLPVEVLCRSGVRTKLGINMVALGELGLSPGCLRRDEPAEGGNAAGKSPRVGQ